jgi:hypothetical protein
VIHTVRMEQTRTRYWFASCSCGWTSPHDAVLATAERAGIAHVREQNKRPAK